MIWNPSPSPGYEFRANIMPSDGQSARDNTIMGAIALQTEIEL